MGRKMVAFLFISSDSSVMFVSLILIFIENEKQDYRTGRAENCRGSIAMCFLAWIISKDIFVSKLCFSRYQ